MSFIEAPWSPEVEQFQEKLPPVTWPLQPCWWVCGQRSEQGLQIQFKTKQNKRPAVQLPLLVLNIKMIQQFSAIHKAASETSYQSKLKLSQKPKQRPKAHSNSEGTVWPSQFGSATRRLPVHQPTELNAQRYPWKSPQAKAQVGSAAETVEG